MTNSLWQKKLLTRITLFLVISLFLSVAVFVPLAYIDSEIATNVAFRIDYLADLLEFLQQAVSLFAFAVTYSVLLYSFFAFGFKKSAFIIFISLFMPIFKNGTNLLSMWLIDGVPAINSVTFAEQLSPAIWQSVFEIVQHTLAILIFYFIIRNLKKFQQIKRKAHAKIGAEFDERTGIFPFEGFYKKDNPLQKAALWSSALIVIVRVLMRVYYDIVMFVLGVQIEEFTDILWMMFFYVSDVFAGVICYFAILFLLMYFDKLSEKLKVKFAN